MSLLDDILNQKRAEIPQLRKRTLPQPLPLISPKLRRGPSDPLRLIAEIKLRSPSAGLLSRSLSVAERARAYESGGATMISVLCDEKFFGGGYHHLEEARKACSLPLLCKEFVIDEVQLDAARAYGASAVLLIVRCLSDRTLTRLIEGAQERQLLPLVEVFTAEEANRARACGAYALGVNARDLDTLEMDSSRAERVIHGLPSELIRAYFSGVKDSMTVARASRSGVDAALIGEVLMKQDDPEPLLRSFVQAAGPLLS